MAIYLKFPAVAALVVLGAAAADAHATWIADRAGQYAIVHGHGATDEAYEPAKVTVATAFDAKGAAVEVALQPTDRNVILSPSEGATVLSGVFDEGWWTEDAAGEWHNAPADGFADFKSAGKYATYAVAYIAPTEVQKAFGHRLEILPLADPATLAIGDKLAVQVLWDGAPMAGVSVTNDVLTDWDIGSPMTDAEGKTTITIANTGLNVAQVYHEIELYAKTVEGHQAVLSFAANGPAKE